MREKENSGTWILTTTLTGVTKRVCDTGTSILAWGAAAAILDQVTRTSSVVWRKIQSLWMTALFLQQMTWAHVHVGSHFKNYECTLTIIHLMYALQTLFIQPSHLRVVSSPARHSHNASIHWMKQYTALVFCLYPHKWKYKSTCLVMTNTQKCSGRVSHKVNRKQISTK